MTESSSLVGLISGLQDSGQELILILHDGFRSADVDQVGHSRVVIHEILALHDVLGKFKDKLALEAYRSHMCLDAESIVKEALCMCNDIFHQMAGVLVCEGETQLPELRWSVVEPKLYMLREDLDRVKTTLELVMSVIDYAINPKEQVINQSRAVEIFKHQEISADIRAKLLARKHYDFVDKWDNSTLALPRGHQQPSQSTLPICETVCLSSNSLTEEDRGPLPVLPEQSVSTMPSVLPEPHQGSTWTSKISNRNEPRKWMPKSGAKFSRSQDAISRACEESVPDEPHMDMLHADYVACVQQLTVLQRALENAMSKLFPPSRKQHSSIAGIDANLTWSERLRVHMSVQEIAEDTESCLNARLVFSPIEKLLCRNATRADVVTHLDAQDPTRPDGPPDTAIQDKQPRAGESHALQNYQVQLMLLEQQNKKRLLMARQEQKDMDADRVGPSCGTAATEATPALEIDVQVLAKSQELLIAAKQNDESARIAELVAIVGEERLMRDKWLEEARRGTDADQKVTDASNAAERSTCKSALTGEDSDYDDLGEEDDSSGWGTETIDAEISGISGANPASDDCHGEDVRHEGQNEDSLHFAEETT